MTLDMMKDERKWFEELARELAGVLQGNTKAGIMKERGIIVLDEVWGTWNHARGVGMSRLYYVIFYFIHGLKRSNSLYSTIYIFPSNTPPVSILEHRPLFAETTHSIFGTFVTEGPISKIWIIRVLNYLEHWSQHIMKKSAYLFS